jgi:hypothetical protein
VIVDGFKGGFGFIGSVIISESVDSTSISDELSDSTLI